MTAAPRMVLCVLTIGRGQVDKRAPVDSLPPVQVEDLLSTASLVDWSASLSPTGEWVAYAAIDPSRARARRTPDTTAIAYTPTWLLGSSVYIFHRRDHRTMQVAGGVGNSWGPAWSPDGTVLAFLSDRDGAPRVWLWYPASGTARALGASTVRAVDDDAVIRWSPDGRSLLIPLAPESAMRRGRLVPPRVPGSIRDTGLTVTVYRATAWPGSRDASQRDSTAEMRDTAAGYMPDVRTRNRRADLAIIDITSGRATRLARDVAPIWHAFSPDGQRVAFANDKGTRHGNNWRYGYDLMLCTRDGRCRTNAHDIQISLAAWWGIGLAWTPDGQGLFYVGNDDTLTPHLYLASVADTTGTSVDASAHPLIDHDASGWLGPWWDGHHRWVYSVKDGALWLLDIDARATREIARIAGHHIVQVLSSQRANGLWTLPGTHVALVSTRNDTTKASGVYAVDLATSTTRRLRESNAGVVWADAFDLSADGHTILFGFEDATHPLDIWVTDSAFRTQSRVSDLNPWTRARRLGRSQLIQWRNSDGEILRGSLLLPAEYSASSRYPLVVLVYGGFPGSNAAYNFGLWPFGSQDNMQLLASRGYVVLLPDLPEHIGTPMMDIAKDVIPGVDRVIELGIADPERVGIIGQSYGGYTALATLVQTTRFRAAVVRAGLVNLVSEYGTMGADGSSFAVGVLEDGSGLMRGTPWQYRDRYLENSPVLYLDRVRTPVLIVHGTADPAVPVSQGDELFVDLRRLGNVEVEYARYTDEGHGLQHYANQRDYLNRMIVWFDRHLKDSPSATDRSAKP